MFRLRHWWLAIRPKTLSLSLVPVCVGTALAWRDSGSVHWGVFLAALIASLLIQIGTNLHNDAADFERGTDGPERVGPARASAQGWFTADEIKRAAHLAFASAFVLGIYLASIGGWPIVLLGLASLAAGYMYTGGPKPIAYSASGELFVFVFFGLAAVAGSYYLQAGHISLDSVLAACGVGLFAAAVLLVNNYRDLETDQRAGKLTLVHYLGRKDAEGAYYAFILLPFVLPLFLRGSTWLTLLALPAAALLIRAFLAVREGPKLNAILARTAVLQMLYGTLLSLGLLI